MVRMDARAEQISNNNALIPLPYAPPDQSHDDLTPVVMAKLSNMFDKFSYGTSMVM
jgi:hypothetical protein